MTVLQNLKYRAGKGKNRVFLIPNAFLNVLYLFYVRYYYLDLRQYLFPKKEMRIIGRRIWHVKDKSSFSNP